jgi:hypothetical protein
MPQTSSKDLATIATLDLSRALLNPSPAAPFSNIGTAQIQVLRQLSYIFTAALPTTSTQHSHPAYQASSQSRNTVHPVPVPMLGFPCPATPSYTPTYLATQRQSPCLARYASLRVIPSQAPYTGVYPRVIPMHVASLRVDPTIPQHNGIPLTPHHSAPNAPYVHQGMAGENLFNTFEEEHLDTPSLPRYNTRARVHQHSAHNIQHHAPRVFHPITFTTAHDCRIAHQHAINPIPMANVVINLAYRQLIQDEAKFPIWNK